MAKYLISFPSELRAFQFDRQSWITPCSSHPDCCCETSSGVTSINVVTGTMNMNSHVTADAALDRAHVQRRHWRSGQP
jgi:hypothetical protein